MARKWIGTLFGLAVLPYAFAVFSLDLYRDIITPTRLNKRDTIAETLDVLDDYLYFANVSVGTPQQTLRLFIDIGAADTWVNTPNSRFCNVSSNNCSEFGTYDADSSSTYNLVNNNFSITYADGSGATGDYATETLYIASNEISALQLGVARNSTSKYGVLGLGYAIQEVQVQENNQQPYPNLPQALANKGLINSNAYSLWLNDLSSTTGTLLFGAVDTNRYAGDLRSTPISSTRSNDSRFLVSVTDIRFGEEVLLSNQNLSTFIDTSTAFTYLPANITTKLFSLVGANYSESQGVAIIDCNKAKNATTLDLTLAWPVINVPMQELVIPLSTGISSICAFGIAPSVGDDSIILGLTTLRSAYMVFDLDNNEISIAPTKSNVYGTNVVEIANGVNGVPGAQRSPTSTASTVVAPTSSSSSSSSNSQRANSSSSLSAGAKAGIGVGVAIGVLAVLGVIAFFWRRKRNMAQDSKPSTEEREGYIKPELSADSAMVQPKLPPVELPGKLQVPTELPGSIPPLSELHAP